ncbi:GntR family transcriptional regulator, partial [[Ruminococcus] torques]|uniref:GntR family transcriptional regulator n=1 Tax=[Ruminococcus] torques TaxID=33039 RepID=UPI0034DDA5CA
MSSGLFSRNRIGMEKLPQVRMRPIVPQPSLVDQVVEAIVTEIVNGDLRPHARLIQDDLAQAYGVSRQPV